MVSKKKSVELPSGWIAQVNVRNGKTVYIEKSTGQKLYSRPQILRYLDKMHPDSSSVKENDDVNGHITGELTKSEQSESVEDKCRISGEKNILQDVNGHSTGELTKSEQSESVEDKCHISGEKNTLQDENGHITGELTKSEQSESVEDKCHISGEKNTLQDVNGHSTGELTKSGQSESVEDKCHISGEKNTPENHSLKEKGNINELDWLPHGWIKELRTRKYKDGFKQDPYYTDPVSGYVFRSKKDVLRFLKTGDIGSCASRPQKRDLTELKLKGVLNSPLPDNVKKEEYSASICQLSAADTPEKDVPDIVGGCENIFPPAEGDISKDKEANCLPFGSALRTSTVDAEEKLQYAEAVECYRSEENSTLTMTAYSRKSKRKPPSVPRRSSKRLASHSPAVKEEVNGSSCLSSEVAVCEEAQQLDTVLKAAPEYRTSSYTEDSPNSNVQVTTGTRDTNSLSNKEVVSEVPLQLDTDIYNEASWDINVHASIIPGKINFLSNNAASSEVPQQLGSNLYFEASLNTDLHATINSSDEQSGVIHAAVSDVPQKNLDGLITSGASALSQSRIDMDLNCTLESCFQDMDVQQQTLVQGYETQKVMDPRFQGDYWSDPCFDFAFKTLAGGMPFEETLELDSCFQPQAGPSYTQEGGVSFVVPDMNAPAFFQNDETYKLDPVPAGISMDHQLPPVNPTSLPVKASLPGCSASDSQPPSLEGRSKEC